MKTILTVDDSLIISLTSAAFDSQKINDREVLEAYLGKVFYLRATASKETKTVNGRPMRLFQNASARLLTTTGALEAILKSKTLYFDHLWVDDQESEVGENYVFRYIAHEYQRIDGTKGYGFRPIDYKNPAELYEVNFRTALALLGSQLLLANNQAFKLDDDSLKLYLRASVNALQESESVLNRMYQSLRYSECRPTRGILSLLNLWLESLERPAIAVAPKKAKAKSKGFAKV